MRINSSFIRNLTIGILAAMVISVSVNAGQDRDTVWTKVTADGSVVSVSWDKHHPWDMQLSGAKAELIAEYRTEARGVVSESLSPAATKRGDERMLQFALPSSVKSQPLGPICLYVQLPGKRTLLPIRRASKEDVDTARFRYLPWEQEVRRQSDIRAAKLRIESAQRDVTASAQRVAAQEAVVSQRGWGSLQGCETISAPKADVGLKPYDVVEPSQQDDVARRVCVHRVWYGRRVTDVYLEETLAPKMAELGKSRNVNEARERLLSVYDDDFIVPEVAGPLLDALKRALGANQSSLGNRPSQAAEFLRDWNRLSPTAGDYDPHLGKSSDVLRWTSTAPLVAFRVFGPELAKQLNAEWAMEGVPPATVTDYEGLVGAALDAYFGCVEDGRKQLKIKYDSWQALQATAPQRAASSRDFLVRECRQEVGKLDQLRTAHTTLQAQLARDQQAASPAAAPAFLSGKSQVLNGSTCNPTQ